MLPRDKSIPPEVFHVVPYLGSAVEYGMDPYWFFFSCREKVRWGMSHFSLLVDADELGGG